MISPDMHTGYTLLVFMLCLIALTIVLAVYTVVESMLSHNLPGHTNKRNHETSLKRRNK